MSKRIDLLGFASNVIGGASDPALLDRPEAALRNAPDSWRLRILRNYPHFSAVKDRRSKMLNRSLRPLPVNAQSEELKLVDLLADIKTAATGAAEAATRFTKSERKLILHRGKKPCGGSPAALGHAATRSGRLRADA